MCVCIHVFCVCVCSCVVLRMYLRCLCVHACVYVRAHVRIHTQHMDLCNGACVLVLCITVGCSTVWGLHSCRIQLQGQVTGWQCGVFLQDRQEVGDATSFPCGQSFWQFCTDFYGNRCCRFVVLCVYEIFAVMFFLVGWVKMCFCSIVQINWYICMFQSKVLIWDCVYYTQMDAHTYGWCIQLQ